MIRPSSRFACSALLASFLAACAADAPPPPVAPPPPADTTPIPPPPPASAAETPPPPPEPTPEEKKKADAAAKLQAARAKFDDQNKTELARWTPEMHAAAKALADKAYPSGKAAIQAAMKGAHRLPGAADRDKYRHPVETLDFFGFKPTMTVLDIGPGETAWYTELLAPALAKKGHYMATSSDPNGPADSMGTLGGQKFAAFLAKSPELYGKVTPVIVNGKAPKLGLDGKVDLVLAMREAHGWTNGKTLDAWLAEIHTALKNGGVLGIVAHRAAPDGDPVATAKNGYLPEKWLIAQVEAAGFKLAGKSEINANPKDTKDYPDGVWSLPPAFQAKDDKDHHDKYAAIGESDRMTLKFVKVALKPAAPAPTK